MVWNIIFFFPYIGFLIIPIDFHIFQRGGPTTNQMIVLIILTQPFVNDDDWWTKSWENLVNKSTYSVFLEWGETIPMEHSLSFSDVKTYL